MSTRNIIQALQGAAGAGGAGLDVDEVFSCHLYEGNGSTQTITNGIDLSGEGGLVWIKDRTRSSGANHVLVDTERGANYWLMSSSTSAEFQVPNTLTSFNSDGFSQNNNNAETNLSGEDFVSWTFRKAPKFFDVQTVTTDSSGNATVNHNLGSSPGFVIVKGLNVTDAWYCFHTDRGVGKFTNLNTPDAESSSTIWSNVSSTTFGLTFGSGSYANKDMVLYLFAHNNSDGNFGPDSDQDIIKCGSYTGNGSATGPTVNLGFEPQFIMYKNVSGTGNWQMHDVMRGIPTGSNDAILYSNRTWAENFNNDWLDVNATGFQIKSSGSDANTNGETYIYMAIRRGPLAEPESASDVFAIDTFGSTGDNKNPGWRSGFPVDMALYKVINGSSDGKIASRLTGNKYLRTNETNAESTDASFTFDYNNGWYDYTGTISSYYSWMWKRAPSYFDVVAYTGSGSAGTHSHNLGIAPEMIWVKNRDGSGNWFVYHSALGATKGIYLNDNGTGATSPFFWNDTAPTASVFSVGASLNQASAHIAYLFATVAGVSKVGSFTGATSDVTVDCGFSNGAKFVIIKDASATDDWYVYDTARGIVAGNDPYLELNTTNAENTGADYIDPHSSGFIITSGFMQSGRTYIFYAVAA